MVNLCRYRYPERGDEALRQHAIVNAINLGCGARVLIDPLY